jgi:DNA mismatch repair protein MutS2
VLELPLILEAAARQATWSRGRDAVLALRPARSRDQALDRQSEVGEAMELDQAFTPPPLRGLRDVEENASAARRGEVLDPAALLDIGQVLRVAVQTRKFFADHADSAPRLAARAEVLTALPSLVAELDAALTSEAEVRETASHRLEEIRVQMRTIQNRIQSKLQSILRNPSLARMFQEPYVTTRNDRYVVPIKAEYRSAFQGLVLDASASGATLFMEPYGVVDLDNELRTLRAAEKHEVERILLALSERVGAVAADISANADILAHLDMCMAVARYGGQIDGRLVPIDDARHVFLRRARHPLLGARAVPIDVEIGEGAGRGGPRAGYRIVIMTGPNTGGKTVTLKTIGLLSLMTLCGMPIPVGDGSRVGFLHGVYADIGDEQSIEQNLSTFSSHLTQISRILAAAGQETGEGEPSRSLVLLDEVGAGTDPREGTALGVSILEHLYGLGALVVATTHYNELKTFASNFEGAMNAAMEFDAESLQPTYHIVMGVPGRSCALEISQRLGLSPAILERARELLGSTHFSVEDLLATLSEEREEAERRQALTQAAHAEADALRRRLQVDVESLQRERAQARARAAREAEDLIAIARDEARRLLEETRERLAGLYEEARQRGGQENGSEGEELRAVDEEEARLRADLSQAATVFREEAEAAEAIERRLTRAPQPEAAVELTSPLRPGDTVHVARLRQEATVAEVRGDEVQVLIGKLRMTLGRREVRKIREAAPSQPTGGGEVVVKGAGGKSGAERRAAMSTRLDLRGFRAEDAAWEVDRYIDEVASANVDQVTIVHGKGTGVLQNVVAERLRAHPRVDSFRPGDSGEGGWGVTVVNLR